MDGSSFCGRQFLGGTTRAVGVAARRRQKASHDWNRNQFLARRSLVRVRFGRVRQKRDLRPPVRSVLEIPIGRGWHAADRSDRSKGNVATMLGWTTTPPERRPTWHTPGSTVMSVALRLDRTVEAGRRCRCSSCRLVSESTGDGGTIDRRRSLPDRRPNQAKHTGAVHGGSELAGVDAELNWVLFDGLKR